MLVLGVLARAVALLPQRALVWLGAWPGAALGWLAGSVFRIRRSHVESSMARALVEDPSKEAAKMYASLGAGVFELLWMAGKRRADAGTFARVDPSSEALLQRAFASQKGVVLAASHTGNWELAAYAFRARVPELLVVVKRQSVGAVARFLDRVRQDYGLSLAEPAGALAQARWTLARRGAVAMLLDQVPLKASHGVDAYFLGERVVADRAPAALAAATGAPLVVTASRRDAEGSHWLEVLAVLSPPARNRSAWVDQATRDATGALERFVRAHPQAWLWLHRRWAIPHAVACFRRAPSLHEHPHG